MNTELRGIRMAHGMRIDQLEPNIVVFRGDTQESVATAILHGGRALLIDTLASAADAKAMRLHLESNLCARVQLVVMTHYMSDHMAGLSLFPEAQIIAHQHFMHTFLSQRVRSEEESAQFVRPTITFTGTFTFEWGGHAIEVFHNPGKTMCAVGIDIPSCDLVLCGDAIVGHTVYLGSSAPEVIEEALIRFQRLGRGRIIPGHIGVLGGHAFGDARHYLNRLRDQIGNARQSSEPEMGIRSIQIEDCLAEGIWPTSFEREWHGRNLDVIQERRLFSQTQWQRRRSLDG